MEFSMAVSKELKKERDTRKSNAEFMLKRNGIDYDSWLDEMHAKVIEDNVPLLISELKEKEKKAGKESNSFERENSFESN